MADLAKFSAQQLAVFDREIQEFRSWYEDTIADERTTFRGWLSELVRVVDRQPDPSTFTISCRVDNLQSDDEGKITYDGVVYLSPKAMLAALEAWEAGDEFLPAHWMEIL